MNASAGADCLTAFNITKFQALASARRPQETSSSCSVAGTAILASAISGRQISEAEVLAAAESDRWTQFARYNSGKMGLDEIATYVTHALRKILGTPVALSVSRFETTEDGLLQLQEILDLRARDSRVHLLANFHQGALGKGKGAGRVSAIGRIQNGLVEILETDKDFSAEPYWISAETRLNAMATIDPDTGRPRGLMVVRVP